MGSIKGEGRSYPPQALSPFIGPSRSLKCGLCKCTFQAPGLYRDVKILILAGNEYGREANFVKCCERHGRSEVKNSRDKSVTLFPKAKPMNYSCVYAVPDPTPPGGTCTHNLLISNTLCVAPSSTSDNSGFRNTPDISPVLPQNLQLEIQI